MKTWTRQDYTRLFLTIFFVGTFALMFVPFYSEILLAAVFAFAMEPSLGRFLRPKHVRWRVSVALILAGMFVCVALPLSVVAYKTYGFFAQISRAGFQNTEVFLKLVELKGSLLIKVNGILEKMNLQDTLDLQSYSEDALVKIGNLVVAISTKMVSNVPDLALSVFIFCGALYYFLSETGPLKRLFYSQNLLPKEQAEDFVGILQTSSYMTVVTSMLLGFVQATLVSIGGALCHAGDIVVIFVVTFFCSFIPVIGAGPVALALALYKFLMGSVGEGVILLVVAGVAGAADNLIRPYLMSSHDEALHPIMSLLALIGALILFGMPGLFLGPVIASVAVKAIPLFYGKPAKAGSKAGDI